MINSGQKKTELKILKNEEKKMNLIMFLFLAVLPIAAWGFVMLFNGGKAKDAIALGVTGVAVLVKLLEKPLGKFAKYVYVSILPICGAIILSLSTPGVYGAMVEAYFLVLFLTIPFYSPALVNFYAAVTFAANVIAMIIVPSQFTVMNTIAVWIFLWLVFLIAVVAAQIIVRRACSLFMQVESNEDRMGTVLSSVKQISENLYTAGTTLSEISTNETNAANELSMTSENLLENSNALREKASLSMTNLNELKESGEELSENVRKVGETSEEVIRKSAENEKALNSLQTINKEVIQSMEETNAVAAKLSEAVQGIDSTLKLINDIAFQTNILSLNASIEAARAGEAGKGFSVVAHEVGNLAARTQNSLSEISSVMDRVRNNVADMTAYVDDNNKKLGLQNEHFDTVFNNIGEINDILQQSKADIAAMNDVHAKQSEIIRHTVNMSADIADSIETSNKEFEVISGMVLQNAQDAQSMTEQVTAINKMAGQIDELLK